MDAWIQYKLSIRQECVEGTEKNIPMVVAFSATVSWSSCELCIMKAEFFKILMREWFLQKNAVWINTTRPFQGTTVPVRCCFSTRACSTTCSDLSNSHAMEASLPSILCVKFPLIISFPFPLIKFNLVPPNQALNKNSNKQFKTQHPDTWMVWKHDINDFRVLFPPVQGQPKHPTQKIGTEFSCTHFSYQSQITTTTLTINPQNAILD